MSARKKTPPIDPVIPVVLTPPAPVEPVKIESIAPVPAPAGAPIPPQPLSPGDERTWAMLSHLSVLLTLITGFAGPIAALIIYVVYKDRSRYVAYHALQSMVFQLIYWYGGGMLIGMLIGMMWAIVGALSAILIGIIFIPFALLFTFLFLLLPIGGLVYGIVGAVQASQGQDFKYWLVGDWVRGTLTG